MDEYLVKCKVTLHKRTVGSPKSEEVPLMEEREISIRMRASETVQPVGNPEYFYQNFPEDKKNNKTPLGQTDLSSAIIERLKSHCLLKRFTTRKDSVYGKVVVLQVSPFTKTEEVTPEFNKSTFLFYLKKKGQLPC